MFGFWNNSAGVVETPIFGARMFPLSSFSGSTIGADGFWSPKRNLFGELNGFAVPSPSAFQKLCLLLFRGNSLSVRPQWHMSASAVGKQGMIQSWRKQRTACLPCGPALRVKLTVKSPGPVHHPPHQNCQK
jgi:hypothetical protein